MADKPIVNLAIPRPAVMMAGNAPLVTIQAVGTLTMMHKQIAADVIIRQMMTIIHSPCRNVQTVMIVTIGMIKIVLAQLEREPCKLCVQF